MTGYPADEAVGKRVRDLLSGVRTEGVLEQVIREALTHGEPAQIEAWLYRRDGTPFRAQISADPPSATDSAEEFALAISDRSTAQGESTQVESLLNEAQARAKIGNWMWCPSTGEHYWSQELYRIFEVPDTRPPLDPEEFSARVHPEDRPAANLIPFLALGQRPTHFEIEYRILCEHDRVKWISAIIDREDDDQGQVQRWSGTAQDITDRKVAEIALKESEQRWNYAIEGSGDSVWDWDIPNKKSVYSKRWKQMLGYEDDEIGTDVTEWSSRVHPDDYDSAILDINAYLSGKTSEYSNEHRLRCKDGSYKWVLDRGVVIKRDAEGNPIRMVGTNTDITSRRASERQFEALAGNVPGVVYQLVIGTDGSVRVPYMSGGCQQVWGFTSEEIQADSSLLWRGVAPDELKALWESVLESTGSLSPWQMEWKHLAANGETRWLQGRAKPERLSNGDTCWDGVIVDVSDQRMSEAHRQLLEIQLREAQKMEAIGTLAGGIAHDFNNILGVILGNVELATQDASPEDPVWLSLTEIRKAATRAKSLVLQILTFSRRKPHQKEVMDLGPLVLDAIGLLRAALPSGVEIVSHLGKDWTLVEVDSTQMNQVLMNLCTNSWQAMPGGSGIIRIALDHYEVGPSPDPKTADLPAGWYAHLVVSDNGSGIAPEALERVFEPFYTTKEIGHGTGLGLSVVHGIVQSHGGAIHVSSTLGQGARFDLYLPLVKASSKPQSVIPVEIPEQAGGGKRILYVDDEEAMVMVVKRILDRKGYRTSVFVKSETALAAFRDNPDDFDLVVTDYNMPGVSGVEVAREIQKIRPTTPIAIVSGYISEELLQKSEAIGVKDVVYKPNTIEELCESIKSLLG